MDACVYISETSMVKIDSLLWNWVRRICATKLIYRENHSNVHHYESSSCNCNSWIIMKIFGCGWAEIGLVKITKYNQAKWNEMVWKYVVLLVFLKHWSLTLALKWNTMNYAHRCRCRRCLWNAIYSWIPTIINILIFVTLALFPNDSGAKCEPNEIPIHHIICNQHVWIFLCRVIS